MPACDLTIAHIGPVPIRGAFLRPQQLINVLQALRILSHSADAEIDNPDTPLALWDKLEKEVRGGFLGMLTVRATFQLRQAGLAAKRYEHITLVSVAADAEELAGKDVSAPLSHVSSAKVLTTWYQADGFLCMSRMPRSSKHRSCLVASSGCRSCRLCSGLSIYLDAVDRSHSRVAITSSTQVVT